MGPDNLFSVGCECDKIPGLSELSEDYAEQWVMPTRLATSSWTEGIMFRDPGLASKPPGAAVEADILGRRPHVIDFQPLPTGVTERSPR